MDTQTTPFDLDQFRKERDVARAKNLPWRPTAEDVRSAYQAGERDLTEADLTEADLEGAYLRRADLTEADLEGAYLRRADLEGAYLRRADLRGADLTGADLEGAYLEGAYLQNITVNWQSHNLVAEILYRAAKGDLMRQSFALLVRQRTEWCWEVWLSDTPPVQIEASHWQMLVVNQRAWALGELRKWVKPNDGAPVALKGKSAE